MRNTKYYALMIFSGLMMFCSPVNAQNPYIPVAVGYVNFDLGKTILPPSHKQTVSLYGCNTRITINGKNWNASDSLQWRTSNQILDSVPFGPQKDTVTGDSFYISKYYIAAPPIIRNDMKHPRQTQYNIGKVIPDFFAFDGDHPMQLIYMDYSRFQLMQVQRVPVGFDSSFNRTGIDILPINIDCRDFPWVSLKGMTNVTGASGIGDLQPEESGNFSGLFLPYYYTNSAQRDSTFLHCEVTILNDIIPYYECYFDVDGDHFTTINLGDVKDKKIVVKAIPRLGNPMPCGCRKPKDPIQCD